MPPPKQSNAKKLANGSKKLHAGEDLAPPIIDKVPAAPAFLKGKKFAVAEWKRVCKLLIEEGILTKWDYPTIQLLCSEWERYRKACDECDLFGEYMVTKTGYQQVTPCHVIRNKSFANYSSLLQRVGADIVSRSRMKRIEPKVKKGNKFDEI